MPLNDPTAPHPPPLVSIAVCTCDGGRFLAAQLDSLLRQTYANCEIVVADDASTDDTPEILRSYAAREPRVRLIMRPRRIGFNANFAQTIAACRGDWIAPSDQDDVWLPEKVQRLVEAIGDADLAYCDSIFMGEDGVPGPDRLGERRRMIAGREPLSLVVTNSVSGHALLCRRDLVTRAEPFPPECYYDWWLAIVAANDRGIRYVDQPLVHFRRHGASATSLGAHDAKDLPAWRPWLAQRARLLRAMARLDGPRRTDALALAEGIEAGLRTGRWARAARLAWKFRGPLTAIVGPRLPSLARRLALGRVRRAHSA